jgi:broad-specificity NMP kinase
MNSKNLIIYKCKSLYHILEEICQDLNFNVYFESSENSLNDKIKVFNNYLILSYKEYLNINKILVLNNPPINLFKLLEKINIELLKIQFNSQAEIKIKNYAINLNSREISCGHIKLNLTEKEISAIIYLSKIKKTVSINELQEKVWGYQYDTETHTVETHIYRLRKKIFNTFNDNDFIKSEKSGYIIK